jgi:hypothetical protein
MLGEAKGATCSSAGKLELVASVAWQKKKYGPDVGWTVRKLHLR